jgi:hypothetical protein
MRVSTRCPTVILDGIAWGLTMISGEIPSQVNGISSWRYVMPIVPVDMDIVDIVDIGRHLQ